MNRRDFVSYALSGLGLAAVPSMLRAASGTTLLAMPGLATNAALGPLLERARAALDAHPERLMLRDRVALADFSAASHQYRLHIVDIVTGQTLSYLVAHGRGSDPLFSGYLQSFSNEPGSQATSEGAYLTGEIYDGTHGVSMRLVGLDPTNNNADSRAIVVHAAPYVSEDHIAIWGKTGRSEGCFVVAPHLITQFLGLLGPGRLLYAAKV